VKNFATLRADSPFFPIFAPSGHVPIMNQLTSSEVRLEGDDETEAYFVDWTALTTAQRAQIGNLVCELRGGTFRQFMKHMADGGRLPLRVSQTTGAQLGADLRSFV